MPIEELTKLLQSEDDCQSLILYLTVAALHIRKRLAGVGNWTFTAINVLVKQHDSNSTSEASHDMLICRVGSK